MLVTAATEALVGDPVGTGFRGEAGCEAYAVFRGEAGSCGGESCLLNCCLPWPACGRRGDARGLSDLGDRISRPLI